MVFRHLVAALGGPSHCPLSSPVLDVTPPSAHAAVTPHPLISLLLCPYTPHLPGSHHHPMCLEQGGRQNRPLWPPLGTVGCQGCGNTQPPSYLHHSGLAQPPGPRPNLPSQASDVEGCAPRCPPCYPARLSPLPPRTARSRSRTAPQPPAGGAAGRQCRCCSASHRH